MGHTAAYKLQRLTPSPSCSIVTVQPDIAWPDTDTDLKGETTVKRLTLTLIAGALLAASLGGCVVVPAGGYYGGGYHHGYYYR
jgi:hypothetical protein